MTASLRGHRRIPSLVLRVAAGCVAAFALAGPAFACDKPATSLKLGLVQPPDIEHPSYAAAVKFKELVEAKTNCALEIKLFPGGQLGGDREMFEAVVIGTQDIGFISPAPISAFTPALDGLSLPWLFNGDLALMRKALTGEPGKKVLKALDADTRVKSLAFMYSPFRDLVSTKPLNSVDALKGVKMRTMQSPLNVEIFAAIGTNPTPMAYPEVYGALQTGVIDAFETDVVGMSAGKFYEVSKFMTRSGHFNNTPVVVMNSGKFRKLPADQQAALQAAADMAGDVTYQMSLDQAKKVTEQLKQRGVTFYDIDVNRLRQAAGTVYAKFEAKSAVTKEFVSDVNKLRAAK